MESLVFVCDGLLFFWSLGNGLEDVGAEIMAMVGVWDGLEGLDESEGVGVSKSATGVGGVRVASTWDSWSWHVTVGAKETCFFGLACGRLFFSGSAPWGP